MSQTRSDIDIHPLTRRPADLLTASKTSPSFDAVILGGGPTGQTAAVRCASGGLSVLLVESELAGGECQNWACVPSKALLRPLEVLNDGRGVGGVRERWLSGGGDGDDVGLDLKGLWDYRDRTTSSWNDEANAAMLGDLGVKVVHGMGSLAGPRNVNIKDWHTGDSVQVAATAVVIATGSEPIVPDIEGVVESRYWTPRDAVSARHVPAHLIILGAGPVGSEFATVYVQLGSKVTLVTRRSRVLPSVVAKASRRVRQGLEALGVTVMTDVEPRKVQRDGERVVVTLSNGRTVEGTELLVAAGRKTRTTGMGLTALGVPEAGPVHVDQHMRATAVTDNWLYAIGDTNGIGNTTHMGVYEATICAQRILAAAGKPIIPGTDRTPANLKDTIPQTCFTHPQVSWVGLSLAEAHSRGLDAREVAVQTGGPGTHSYLHAEGYEGWAMWVVEVSTGKILGAVFVGQGVANLLHASTVAVATGLTWMQMLHAVPSFPTLSEAYNLLVQECLSTKW